MVYMNDKMGPSTGPSGIDISEEHVHEVLE